MTLLIVLGILPAPNDLHYIIEDPPGSSGLSGELRVYHASLYSYIIIL